MILKCQSSLPCMRKTVEIVLKLSKLLCSLHVHDFNPYHFQDLLNYLSSSKEINLDYSLERLMLKLKLQYFGHLMKKANSLEKMLMLGKIEGTGRREWQNEMVGWHHRLSGHEYKQVSRDSEGQGSLACCSPWGHKESDTTEQLNNNDSLI